MPTTTLEWRVEPPAVDLAEIMDELDPGWSRWPDDASSVE